MDTHSYKGWLNSDKFWKRALAIYGYQMALSLAAMGVIFVIAFLVGFFQGLFGY